LFFRLRERVRMLKVNRDVDGVKLFKDVFE